MTTRDEALRALAEARDCAELAASEGEAAVILAEAVDAALAGQEPPQSDGSYVERYTAICEGFDGFGGDTDEKFHAQVVALLREADALRAERDRAQKACEQMGRQIVRLRALLNEMLEVAGSDREQQLMREPIAVWAESIRAALAAQEQE